MRAFFTINIMFGVKQLPRLWNYWSPDIKYGDPYISSIMSKMRYSKISQYLHLIDSANAPSKNDPNYNPLYKVRPVIDLLLNSYKTVYLPGKNLSVDEAMIGYKGRVHFQQYMPAKPTKWGIKIWDVCESDTGYCVNFDVYTGKKYNGNKPYGLGHDVVWSLTEPFYHRSDTSILTVFFFFFSDFGRKSYTCSTVMGNCKGLLCEMKTKF
ncbi:piggyBac transposable element-derived protein 4-like [Octopus bimaculoides]|uniref:piggyBac transposable element-derived protein 4-like n=1 Tax=Octopus bimaculoides TaxID=37653 RepID=UPI00071CDF4B|nr:piggyBac transposable element-derived protein 4-like [Octopus bimaculoides]|eukprot:XP_014784704.1 PREDICTED: piggyBac transposable element-derived protein 4-like [Octopus bimaculoides]